MASVGLRVVWVTLGLASVGVGSIGVVVPGLPTTVFFVFAAWCFSKANPRLEAWLLALPAVGPLVADYRAGLGMPKRAKVVAAVMISAACGISAAVVEHLWVSVAILLTGAVGIYWVLARVPTRRPDATVSAGDASRRPPAPSG